MKLYALSILLKNNFVQNFKLSREKFRPWQYLYRMKLNKSKFRKCSKSSLLEWFTRIPVLFSGKIFRYRNIRKIDGSQNLVGQY